MPPPTEDNASQDVLAPRQATLREVAVAVLWSFFGVRKGEHMRKDAVSIRPHQVVIVGVALAALLVLTLIFVVRIVLWAAGV